MAITFNNLMRDLKNDKISPLYFLEGEEPYYIDIVSDYISDKILKEEEKAFNLQIFYGKDTSIETIISSAKRYPMMSRYNVIVVREAQQLGSLEGLEHYLINPLKTTILVFCYKYKKLDKRLKLTKLIADCCVVLDSDKLKEEKVQDWINSYVTEKGLEIEINAQWMLVDFLGNDLAKLANEIDKLILLLPDAQKKITDLMVEQNIGMSKDFNSFELTRALTCCDISKANRIIGYFEKNPKNNSPFATIGTLFYYFGKILLYHGSSDKSREALAAEMGINPYFIAEYQQAARVFSFAKTSEIIGLLREYDVKLKGLDSTAPDGELMRELIYKILH